MRSRVTDIFLNFGILVLALAIGRQVGKASVHTSASGRDQVQPVVLSDWQDHFPGRRVVGVGDGPVGIILFTDYQCPWCRALYPVLTQLRESYPDRIGVSIRHFPNVGLHPAARHAALVAECAADQGRLDQVEPLLYAERTVPLPSWDSIASQVDIRDGKTFAACIAEEIYSADIDADMALGRRLGITATPTMFVNGQVVVGLRSIAELDSIVREALGAAK